MIDFPHLALREEKRVYNCPVCGMNREITVKRIEKFVVVCLHYSEHGEELPVMQRREEGKLVDASRP